MPNAIIAGWSSLAARRAHNPKVVGSNPAPATNLEQMSETIYDYIIDAMLNDF
jgi:hypothetical protein